MWTINIVIIFCILSKKAFLRTEAANLFDAVGSVIGLDNGNNGNGNLNHLPPNNNQFRNNFNNNNFRPNNNQFLPKPKPSINNGAFNNGGFNNGGINNNNFIRPNNNNKPNNNGAVLEPFRNKEESLSGLTEEEKRAAQNYPGIANLLAQLRELNRQRELQKQNGQNGNGNGNNNINNNIINGGTAKNGWKILQRRKFAFQAKPVRPDNEIVAANEKVYYID